MTAADGRNRISRMERIARATVGMPVGHPELITRKPGRAEWQELAIYLIELWPNDEYTAIVAQAQRLDRPPGTQG
jgi:hypothetical protein